METIEVVTWSVLGTFGFVAINLLIVTRGDWKLLWRESTRKDPPALSELFDRLDRDLETVARDVQELARHTSAIVNYAKATATASVAPVTEVHEEAVPVNAP
jgi:predicted transcriptional regulator